jgi:hypothetical protein
MTLFLITFAIIAVVIALMAIGVMFGRDAIKGSCGGVNSDCVCVQKCEKRLKMEAEQATLATQE